MFFKKRKKVEVLKTNEQKLKEQSEFLINNRCPLCSTMPDGVVYTSDELYNYFTCKKCNCDYRVLK